MHHNQTHYSILELLCVYEYFCEYTLFFRIIRGGCGNYIILHHANVSIVEDNILWHLDGPSERTGSHEHWFQGCKVDLVTHS